MACTMHMRAHLADAAPDCRPCWVLPSAYAAVRADVTADDGRGAWEAAGAMSVSLGDEEMRVLEEKARASS